MKNYRINSVLPKNLYLLLLMWIGISCTKEDMSDCQTSYFFTVKAYDVDNTELTNPVNDVILYVFDKDFLLIKREETQLNATVRVDVERGDEVHVVAWGNLSGTNQHFTEPGIGEHLDVGNVSLKSASALEDSRVVHHSPDDLFHGNKSATVQDTRNEIIVPILRKMGNINITIRGLRSDNTKGDENYSIVVHETYNQLDFSGNKKGGRAVYKASGTFTYNVQVGKEDYIIPSFNMMPENGINIDIYDGTYMAYTVRTHNDGNPIVVQEGRTTNVLIDVSAALDVRVAMTPWGEKAVWKEY